MPAQTKDVTVRVQALDGTWETLGSDRASGVWPETVQPASDSWGPSTLSLELHRDPNAPWPDISAFTPIDVEIGGVLRWSGRVKETPSRNGTDMVMGVQGEGWQYHLDDDVLSRAYVHANPTAWKDIRSHLAANLSIWTTVGRVEVGSGVIVLTHATGTTVPSSPSYGFCGAFLDFGQGNTAQRVSIDWETSNNNASFALYVGRSNSDPGNVQGGDRITFINAASGTSSFTLGSPSRWVMLYLANDTGSPIALSADVWARITGVRVYADTSYESSNESALLASTVVNDVVQRACPLLGYRGLVGTSDFNVPTVAPGEPMTPREYWSGVNAYHDHQSQVDASRQVIFRAKPTVAVYEVGEWSAMEFDDASANSGQDIYNRVLVTAQTPGGEQSTVARYAATGAATTQFVTVSSPSLANPSFDTVTTGWTLAGSGTFTRSTGTFDSSPASGFLSLTGATNGNVTAAFSGTFLAGVPYTLKFAAYIGYGSAICEFGVLGSDQVQLNFTRALGLFRTFYLTWIPTADTSSASVRFTHYGITGAGGQLYIDTFSLLKSTATIVDRRGFQRTKILQVASALPADGVAAAKIGDTWLAGHRTTPFRGTLKITGSDSIREVTTGRPVAPDELLGATGQLLRFSDRIDPDTGAFGRDGRIASATYDVESDTATVAIDSSRAAFDALLARLAVVTGTGR